MAATGSAAPVRRPLLAVVLLLAVYGLLSLLNDPRGQLGSDSGGKVATLKVMAERGRFDPDLGYWAADLDPAGRVHPVVLTERLGDRWVNVTTLPMLYAAYPLYRLGGYRLALIPPMLGGVAAALAARALARRLSDGDGWAAFWLIGLASPVLVYALDFWEHTCGLAAMAWAMVLLWDLVERRRGWPAALAAGALFGVAATMRTEALAYGAVAVAAACLLLLGPGPGPGRRLRPALVAGVAAGVGLLIPLAVNLGLELATFGRSLRSGRAAGAAAMAATDAGADLDDRLTEAVVGAVGLFSSIDPRALLLGLALAGLLAAAALLGRAAAADRACGLALAGAASLYAARMLLGPGVLPGLATAAPLVVVGVVLGWSLPRARYLLVVALASLPVVWATQYPGSSLNHLGARYILLSGLLFTVVGVAALPRLRPWCGRAFVGLAVVATGFAMSWMVVRTHAFARAGEALNQREEPVLISRFLRLAREGGAFYGERRWLSAYTDADQRFAVGVVERAGIDRFGLVLPPDETGAAIPGWRRLGSDRVALLRGFDLTVVTYQRAGAPRQ